MFVVCFLLVNLILVLSNCEGRLNGVDIDLKEDSSKWVDPGDPLSSNNLYLGWSMTDGHSNEEKFRCDCKRHILSMKEEMKICTYGSVDVLLKHILRRFFTRLNVNLSEKPSRDIFKLAQVHLKAEEILTINRYLSSEKASEEMALRENLRVALDNFLFEMDTRSEGSMFTFIRHITPYVTMANLLVFPPSLYLVFREFVSFRKGFTIMIMTAFLTSCYFTYTRKYQEILAQRFERMELSKRVGGSACSPQGLMSEALNVILGYVMIKEKSDCLRSFEDVLIEPIWLVDPLTVIGEVLANFFFSPLSIAGRHLNIFLREYFVNSPLHLSLIKLLLVPVFLYIAFHFLTRLFVFYYIGGYQRSENTNIDQRELLDTRNFKLSLRNQSALPSTSTTSIAENNKILVEAGTSPMSRSASMHSLQDIHLNHDQQEEKTLENRPRKRRKSRSLFNFFLSDKNYKEVDSITDF